MEALLKIAADGAKGAAKAKWLRIDALLDNVREDSSRPRSPTPSAQTLARQAFAIISPANQASSSIQGPDPAKSTPKVPSEPTLSTLSTLPNQLCMIENRYPSLTSHRDGATDCETAGSLGFDYSSSATVASWPGFSGRTDDNEATSPHVQSNSSAPIQGPCFSLLS
jgi:hypothetical protein